MIQVTNSWAFMKCFVVLTFIGCARFRQVHKR